MEFPDLGKNCNLKGCNQLDFLPIKCDACSNTYCSSHYQYCNHTCEKANGRDNQVPVCPLCSKPVPLRRGQLPDITVSNHIDQYCSRNDKLKEHQRERNKPKSNLAACSFESCRQKDVIYLECSDCNLKFCIKHRHPSDHVCTKPRMIDNMAENWKNFRGNCSSNASTSLNKIKNKAQQLTKSSQNAINNILGNTAGTSGHQNTNRHRARSIQGDLSEQEALSIAISESNKNLTVKQTQTSNNIGQQEEEDLALAKALQESQMEEMRRIQRAQTKDSCALI